MPGNTSVSVTPKVEVISNDEILLYHQIALDMNSEELTQERAQSILEKVNEFSKRFPGSPHLAIAKHWKNILEEIIVRAKRLEAREKEEVERKETKKLSNIAEREPKKSK